jgi:hypothetical protein
MDNVLGTCNLCGGAVTTPAQWMSTQPPVPTCQRCGATRKHPHGSVIEMEPRRDAATLAEYRDAWKSQHPPTLEDLERARRHQFIQ